MFLRKGVKIVSFLFLIAFIFVKASGFHAFTHHDDGQQTEHCMWCDVAVESTQQVSLIQFFDFSINTPPVQDEIAKPLASQTAFPTFHADGTLFCRPPPVL